MNILKQLSPLHIYKEGYEREMQAKEAHGLSRDDLFSEAGWECAKEVTGIRLLTLAKVSGSILLVGSVVIAAAETVEALSGIH